MAIGDGVSDLWEVFQFAEAELVAPDTWDLSLRLRGQAGTDGVMPEDWPAGSRVVLLDGVPAQWNFPASLRERERHYRWGPATRGPCPTRPGATAPWRSGASGLRPYAVCHLRAARRTGGDLRLDLGPAHADRRRLLDRSPRCRWARTARPTSSGSLRDGAVLREAEVASPAWTYAAAERAADGPGPVTVAVAQLSDRFGPGPFRSLDLANP